MLIKKDNLNNPMIFIGLKKLTVFALFTLTINASINFAVN